MKKVLFAIVGLIVGSFLGGFLSKMLFAGHVQKLTAQVNSDSSVDVNKILAEINSITIYNKIIVIALAFGGLFLGYWLGARKKSQV